MKIASPFKDYYDHIAYAYGGGDPSIIYERRRIGAMKNIDGATYADSVDVEVDSLVHLSPPPYRFKGFIGYNGPLKWLIVCGKPYLVIDTSGDQGHPAKFEIFKHEKHHHHFSDPGQERYREPEVIGIEDPTLIALSRVVGHPVFIINKIRYTPAQGGGSRIQVNIHGDCPILGALGFAATYPADQLFQDISYFMVNKMKESPDLAPPSNMTDKEKISQHGFDTKQSFRHRK